MTVNDPAAVLPRESSAEHWTTVVPTGNCDPEAGEHSTGTLPSTRSMAVGSNVTTAPEALVAETTTSSSPSSSGPAVSVTVTVNVPSTLWPKLSVAVQTTSVLPIGNVEPDAGSHETDGSGSLLRKM